MTAATATSESTRDKILQSAFDEFYQNGYQGGSLNRIVQEAGITKGALFHHFKGKDELGYTVVEERIRPMVHEHWITPLKNSNDPVTDIIRLLQDSSEAHKDHLCQGCPLNNLAQEMSPLDEGFRTRINAIYEDWRLAITQAFERGLAHGTVKPEISPTQVGAFIVSSMAGIIGAAKNAQSHELMMAAATELVRYLKGLRQS